MEQPTVVIPLRAGKSRLADALSPAHVQALRNAMFADVVAAVRAAGLQRVLVAAGDQESASVARGLQVPFRLDPPTATGLDDAITAAADASTRRGEDLVVVQADLPALTGADVAALVGAEGAVVLAPTADGGTGALLRRPAGAIPTAYGPESAARHAARALDRGILPTVLSLAGFDLDVDTPEDLARLAVAENVGPHTRAWLRDQPVLAVSRGVA